jgi:hypothetical protein
LDAYLRSFLLSVTFRFSSSSTTGGARVDGNLAPYEVITLQEQLDRSTSPQLVAVTLVVVLAGLTPLLAVIGLYGVMS